MFRRTSKCKISFLFKFVYLSENNLIDVSLSLYRNSETFCTLVDKQIEPQVAQARNMSIGIVA